MNTIKLIEPNTALNDVDHVGSFDVQENIVFSKEYHIIYLTR